MTATLPPTRDRRGRLPQMSTGTTLESRLRRFLDDGTGRVHEPLVPLLNARVMMP